MREMQLRKGSGSTNKGDLASRVTEQLNQTAQQTAQEQLSAAEWGPPSSHCPGGATTTRKRKAGLGISAINQLIKAELNLILVTIQVTP